MAYRHLKPVIAQVRSLAPNSTPIPTQTMIAIPHDTLPSVAPTPNATIARVANPRPMSS